jgi:hypothetical protein
MHVQRAMAGCDAASRGATWAYERWGSVAWRQSAFTVSGLSKIDRLVIWEKCGFTWCVGGTSGCNFSMMACWAIPYGMHHLPTYPGTSSLAYRGST